MLVLALAVRVWSVASSGGLTTTMGYDDGVYFAATNGLLHGVIPYRDFVIVHPPGIMLLGAGPVWLAHHVGFDDRSTFVVVRILFLALGLVNTALVHRAGRHLSPVAALLAGALYAVWLPMVREERTMLLEPVVALGTLAGLALVPPVSARPLTGRWRPLIAGALAGIAMTTKIWAIAPVAVIAAGLVLARRWRRATAYVGSVAVTATAVVGPFLLLAPHQVLHMVVLDQLGRPQDGDSRIHRLQLMADDSPDILRQAAGGMARLRSVLHVPPMGMAPPPLGEGLVVLGIAAVTVGSVIAARRYPLVRLWLALVLVQGAVLLVVPTFFSGYPSFVGPAAVLVLAAIGHVAWTAARISKRATRWALASAAAMTVAALGWSAGSMDLGTTVNRAAARLIGGAHCLATDDPVYLALTDTLTSNLEHRCWPVADFTGEVYATAHPDRRGMHDTALRRGSTQYQSFVLGYFDQADWILIRRRHVDGLGPQVRAYLAGRELLHLPPAAVYGPPVPTLQPPAPGR